jgi:hypothetical protein
MIIYLSKPRREHEQQATGGILHVLRDKWQWLAFGNTLVDGVWEAIWAELHTTLRERMGR